MGKQPKPELPPLAKRFRRLLGNKGWSVAQLHREAMKRFGDDAATPQSFRRLVTKQAPATESKTVRQAEVILEPAATEEPKTTIDQIADDGNVMGALLPIIGTIPAARDATEEQIITESRRLMNSRHASLHALLTLLLANK